jgi:hypothetical protein
MLMAIGGIFALIWGFAALKIVWDFIFPTAPDDRSLDHIIEICIISFLVSFPWLCGSLLFLGFSLLTYFFSD